MEEEERQVWHSRICHSHLQHQRPPAVSQTKSSTLDDGDSDQLDLPPTISHRQTLKRFTFDLPRWSCPHEQQRVLPVSWSFYYGRVLGRTVLWTFSTELLLANSKTSHPGRNLWFKFQLGLWVYLFLIWYLSPSLLDKLVATNSGELKRHRLSNVDQYRLWLFMTMFVRTGYCTNLSELCSSVNEQARG